MAIYHRIEQRSSVWFYRRAGLPTASEFHRIITPKGKLSEARVPGGGPEGYMHELLAELMLGRPLDLDVENYQSSYMQRGIENEDAAIDSFEFQRGVETSPGGFVTNDVRTYGCSPDRLIGTDGGLELKIPGAKGHMRYLIAPECLVQEYKVQVQGSLLVTGRDYWEQMSWHPELPPVIRRVPRDEEFIALLKAALYSFAETLVSVRCKLESLYGPFPPIVIPVEARGPEEIDPLGFDVTPADVARMVATGLSVPAEAK